jgi:5'-3' exoribonuclease 1
LTDIVSSAELCPTSAAPDKVIKDMKRWLKEQDLLDLEPVSLFAEQLEKVGPATFPSTRVNTIQDSVAMIERVADGFRASKSQDAIKRALVKGIPRQAVLKPAHAIYRLQRQTFALGDRVIMVVAAAAGGVPLAMKGVVMGLGSKDIDVLWDVPFMGGETLGGR